MDGVLLYYLLAVCGYERRYCPLISHNLSRLPATVVLPHVLQLNVVDADADGDDSMSAAQRAEQNGSNKANNAEISIDATAADPTTSTTNKKTISTTTTTATTTTATTTDTTTSANGDVDDDDDDLRPIPLTRSRSSNLSRSPRSPRGVR